MVARVFFGAAVFHYDADAKEVCYNIVCFVCNPVMQGLQFTLPDDNLDVL